MTANVRRAVIGDDHRHPHRLTGNDHAVVGERFDSHAVGGNERLLELTLLLAQAELDLTLRHRRRWPSCGARLRSTRSAYRPASSGCTVAPSPSVSNFFRAACTDEAITARPVTRSLGGRAPANLARPAMLVSTPSNSDRSQIHLAGNRGRRELERGGRRSGQREQLRLSLALVHAARLGANLRIRPAEQ